MVQQSTESLLIGCGEGLEGVTKDTEKVFGKGCVGFEFLEHFRRFKDKFYPSEERKLFVISESNL